MENRLKYILLLFIVATTACNTEKKTDKTGIQNESVFPKGEKLNSNNFSGTVWLKMFGANDSTLHVRYGNVTFEPKARTNWHSHPGGQILFITEGTGYYQAIDQPVRLLQKGDVVEIPRNTVHWHGAAPDSEFSHIAVSLNTDEGGAVWIGSVTDKDYNQSIN